MTVTRHRSGALENGHDEVMMKELTTQVWEEQVSRPIVFAVLALISNTAFLAAAQAAPPTVTPSPGYDARLQEQRKGTSTSMPERPSSPNNPPVQARRHSRRTHRH
jgi:hypothetical protein